MMTCIWPSFHVVIWHISFCGGGSITLSIFYWVLVSQSLIWRDYLYILGMSHLLYKLLQIFSPCLVILFHSLNVVEWKVFNLMSPLLVLCFVVCPSFFHLGNPCLPHYPISLCFRRILLKIIYESFQINIFNTWCKKGFFLSMFIFICLLIQIDK